MKNILYIGHYEDINGLGASSRRYIDWLSNYNLSIRPIYVTHSVLNEKSNKHDKYNEYENNSSRTYDTLIQHTLPEYLEYHKNFGKNIAIPEIETINIKHSGWIDKLNLMDEVWVNSQFSANSLINSGLKTPIRIIPEPYNIKKYQENKNSFFEYKDNKPFIFYTIGQYTEKRNIKNIIMAYLLEFNKQDNVKLFIKTYDHRKKNEDLEHIIKYDMSTIKNIIRKNPDSYPDIDILCGYLSDNDIIRLHRSSNCYINASKADGFGASAIEAALCDNIIINTKNIGSATYFNNTNAIMVNSLETPVMCSNTYSKNIFTIYEKWFEPEVLNLRQSLRKAYDLSSEQTKSLNNNFNKELFSYEFIETLLS